MQGFIPKQLNSALFIGAHCDDIEIGCGATIQQLVRAFPNAEFHWVVLASNPTRAAEARRSAELYLAGCARGNVDVQAFRDGYFPYIGREVKDYFEDMKKRVRPDVIFTHHGADLHQDHRMTSELTWNTFRDHVILEYEIPKYDGGLGGPNVFVPVTEQQRDCKVDRLLECFVSERGKAWFTRETFLGLMRLRGIECNAPGGYAEAFHCRKLVWSVDGLRGS